MSTTPTVFVCPECDARYLEIGPVRTHHMQAHGGQISRSEFETATLEMSAEKIF